MPAPPKSKDKNGGDKDKIPITSPQQLLEELKAFKTALSVVETEHTWQALDRALQRYTAVTRGGGCKYEEEYIQGLKDRELAKAIIGCISTERTTLSASALVFMSSATRLGHAFAPLVSLYLPHILRLLSRTNKLYISRATACLISIIRNTRLTSVIPYLREGMDEKPASHRKGCIAGILCALGGEEGFEMAEGILVDKEVLQRRYLDDVERCIRIGARDKDIEVRRLAKKAWLIYRREFSDRINSFAAPLTPTIRKYLELPPPGQAISTFSATSSHSQQAVKPSKGPQPTHHVARNPAPPRAPSPTKPSTARPPSRNDLGRSTSSAVLGRSVGPSTIAAQQQISHAAEFRPPSRQALPPNPLARSMSATTSIHQRAASQDHPEQAVSRHNLLSRSVTSSILDSNVQSFPFERPTYEPPPASVFPLHERQVSASSSTSHGTTASEHSDGSRRAFRPNPPISVPLDNLEAPVRPAMPAHRPPSREQLPSNAIRPVAAGPRRAGPGRHRPANNSGPVQPFQLKSGRAPLPPPATTTPEEEVEETAREEEIVPQKRPASAMSSASVASLASIGQSVSRPESRHESPVEKDMPSGPALGAAASTTEDLKEPTLIPVEAPPSIALPPSEDVSNYFPPQPVSNPLSMSCPPSSSTFAAQPPPPAVVFAALAAQLPKQSTNKGGRPAFRPARPNTAAASSSQAPGQVRRVPSAMSLPHKPATQARSISASTFSSKPPTSLKDTLAQDRSQAPVPVKKPSNGSQSAQAAPPAKRQALTSSTSSSTSGRPPIQTKASQPPAQQPSTAPLAPALRQKAPAFKPTAPVVPKPRIPSGGSIFSRLAAPTASSAARSSASARARVVSSTATTAQPKKEDKVKEMFKKPGLPSSKSDKKLAATSASMPSDQTQAQQQVESDKEADEVMEPKEEEAVASTTIPDAQKPEAVAGEEETRTHLFEQEGASFAQPTAAVQESEVLDHAAILPLSPSVSEASAMPLPSSPVKSHGDTEKKVDTPVRNSPVKDAGTPEDPAEVGIAPSSASLASREISPSLASETPVRQEEQHAEAPTPSSGEAQISQNAPLSPVPSELVNEDDFRHAEPEAVDIDAGTTSSVCETETKVEAGEPPNTAVNKEEPAEEPNLGSTPPQEEGEHSEPQPSETFQAPVLEETEQAEGERDAAVQSEPEPPEEQDAEDWEENVEQEEKESEDVTMYAKHTTSDAEALPQESMEKMTIQPSPERPVQPLSTSPPATTRKIETAVFLSPSSYPALPDPTSSSILYSPSKMGDGGSALMLEDEPTHLDIDDTVIEHGVPSEEDEEAFTGEEEEEDDVALLISRELSDDSLEELASRFEGSRLHGLDIDGDDEEDVENTPVRPRLYTSRLDDDEDGTEEEQEDDTQTLNFSTKGNNILGGLSKTPSAVTSKQLTMEENNVLRTL